jgi:hypothetical protein
MAAKPRFATIPTKGAKTYQVDLWRGAESFGTPFMPWQKRAARLLGEYRPELCKCHKPARWLPRFKTIAVTVPRQQGKTVLARVAVNNRAHFDPNSEMYGTAQTRQYAAKHVIGLGKTLQKGGVKLYKGVGNEKVVWPNGSEYRPISPNEGGGHGDSIDFMLIDEAWMLSMSTLGGLAPAMIARPHSQMLLISTMGTKESSVWNGIVAEGREAVDNPDSNMAYLEYSAPDDEVVLDDSQWAKWMPALGRTVTKEDIHTSMRLMLADADLGPSEVVRAFGNRTVEALVTVFPQEWIAAAWRVIQPPESFVLALDVNTRPDGASLSTAHYTTEGTTALRNVEWRYGSPTWLPEVVERMLKTREVSAVVGDFGGPSRAIKDEVQRLCDNAGVALLDRLPRDLAADTQAFYDALRDGKVHMQKDEPLSIAVSTARKKNIGDLWLVSRRHMAQDASPIISAILAFGQARELTRQPSLKELIHF